MQHAVQKLPRSQLEITVTVPGAAFEQFFSRAAEELSREVEIKGFRKGRAPLDMVRKAVGEKTVLERAADLTVRTTYPKVLAEVIREFENGALQEFFSLGAPEITVTKLAPGNELIYKALLSYLPEMKLPDYCAIAQAVRVKKQEVSVSAEEVSRAIDWIRESRAREHAVDRPAAKGDVVELDFEVRHGGVRLEHAGSSAHPIVLGKGKFMPGFEDEILGMRRGDGREFSIVAPPDWREKSLAGKALDFKVQMRAVRERALPELNDEFVRGLGNFSSVDSLKENVRQGLEEEKREKERERVRIAMIDEITRNVSIDIPDVLIEREQEKMLQELKVSIERMGMKWNEYLTHIKRTPEDLKKEWWGEAERRSRIALVLRKIARLEKIAPSDAEVEERANQYLRQFGSVEEAKKSIDPKEFREYTKGVLRNEKVFEWLEQC